MIRIVINVHEKPDFLLKQLKNIQEHVKSDFHIVFSCNAFMYHQLSSIDFGALPFKICINPHIIEKRTYHGSLTHGIVSNMSYPGEYDYLLVLSSRSWFHKSMTEDDLKKLKQEDAFDQPDYKTYLDKTTDFAYDINNYIPFNPHWWWPKFSQTTLGRYVLENGGNLYGSTHEGLVFSRKACDDILDFLNHHEDLWIDTINTPLCVEEFALQTIAMFTNNTYANTGFNDGHKDCENKYTHRVRRL